MPAPLRFWFEFASPYSWLAAMRIGAEAERRGVTLAWQPFLLGPIFAERGWPTSPFVLYPDKGLYMWRDVERQAEKYGLTLRRPDRAPDGIFPQNGLLAARLCLIGLDEGWGEAFARAVFTAAFSEGRDISRQDALAPLIAAQGAEPEAAFAAAAAPATKARLRAAVEEARRLHIFGTPSFTVGGELFWGNDRLEDALDLARETPG